MSKTPLVILTGPTAVGKTALSIRLAKEIGAEIISADSMQVYKLMDIGTAKIMPREMQGIPHHLVDCFMPDEPFNVVIFQQEAKKAISAIYERGHIPLVVGGTGFYIQALLNDVDFSENDSDYSYRKELEACSQTEEGAERLYELLCQTDPEAAKAIHPNNVKRIIRALEYYQQTGERISEHNAFQRQKTSAYNSAYFVLNMPRDLLYRRIEERIDQMMDQGLLDEVMRLKEKGYSRSLVSMQGLGYKQLLAYLDHEMTLEEATALIKRDTRRFAKRQLTWFRREADVQCFDKSAFASEDEILHAMLGELKRKNII